MYQVELTPNTTNAQQETLHESEENWQHKEKGKHKKTEHKKKQWLQAESTKSRSQKQKFEQKKSQDKATVQKKQFGVAVAGSSAVSCPVAKNEMSKHWSPWTN